MTRPRPSEQENTLERQAPPPAIHAIHATEQAGRLCLQTSTTGGDFMAKIDLKKNTLGRVKEGEIG